MERTRGSGGNLTRRADVKACFTNLKHLHGEESQPRTAATRRMVALILGPLIERHFALGAAGDEMRARARLMIAVEAMLGLRVGEALSGGDFHGMLANHLSILTSVETGE